MTPVQRSVLFKGVVYVLALVQSACLVFVLASLGLAWVAIMAMVFAIAAVIRCGVWLHEYGDAVVTRVAHQPLPLTEHAKDTSILSNAPSDTRSDLASVRAGSGDRHDAEPRVPASRRRRASLDPRERSGEAVTARSPTSAKARALAMSPTLVAEKYRQFARSPWRWWVHLPGDVGSIGDGRTEAKAWHAAVRELEVRGAVALPARTMSPGEDLRLTQRAMLSILMSQQSRRGEYPGCSWMSVEIDVMHHAINCDRSKRGFPDIDRARVVGVERMAFGHSDYSSKFALYCAELALTEVSQ